MVPKGMQIAAPSQVPSLPGPALQGLGWRWVLLSPFLFCSHHIAPRGPAVPAQEAQTLPERFEIKPYAVSKTNEEVGRAKAGTG